MILKDLCLPSRRNQKCQYSGLDSIKHCLDKTHFENYPFAIDYSFNTRGFRDLEWPSSLNELKEAVWCVGDSFTVGIGQPLEHTWPYVLSKSINRRTINISMDGASNDWILRRAQQIIDEIQPSAIVIMWSYTHRRESRNHALDDESRRIDNSYSSEAEDYQHFQTCVYQVHSATTQVLHYVIPGFIPDMCQSWLDVKGSDWPDQCPKSIEELTCLPNTLFEEIKQMFYYFDLLSVLILDQICWVQVPRLDMARDGHHFDLLTSQWLANHAAQRLEV